MAYWWASQGKNFDSVVADGTLWSCPRGPNGVLYVARTLLKSMRVGDTVFHYANEYLRAVSRVVVEWQMAPRAQNYRKIHDDDWDVGWLVRVEVIEVGIAMEFHELRKFMRIGEHGPLDKNGTPAQKYISALTDEEGEKLLGALGLDASAGDKESPVNTHWTDVWDRSGATDAPSQTSRRLEQGELRKWLLQGRAQAPCDVCRRNLPGEFLVSAHIRPRRSLSDVDRKDFGAIAMLACSLGCDALFEKGLIAVGNDRRVRQGARAETDDLRTLVNDLVGGTCLAHNEKTAAAFNEHLVLATA